MQTNQKTCTVHFFWFICFHFSRFLQLAIRIFSSELVLVESTSQMKMKIHEYNSWPWGDDHSKQSNILSIMHDWLSHYEWIPHLVTPATWPDHYRSPCLSNRNRNRNDLTLPSSPAVFVVEGEQICDQSSVVVSLIIESLLPCLRLLAGWRHELPTPEKCDDKICQQRS